VEPSAVGDCPTGSHAVGDPSLADRIHQTTVNLASAPMTADRY
jgi:hypothetical protein